MKSKCMQGGSHQGETRKAFTSNPPPCSPRMILCLCPRSRAVRNRFSSRVAFLRFRLERRAAELHMRANQIANFVWAKSKEKT